MDNQEYWFKYFKKHPCKFAETYCGAKLTLFQKIILKFGQVFLWRKYDKRWR